MNNNLIDALGISTLTKTEQEIVLEDFNKKLFKVIFNESLKKIPEKEKEICFNILNNNNEKKDYEKIEKIFINKIKDYENFVKKIIEEFIKIYILSASKKDDKK